MEVNIIHLPSHTERAENAVNLCMLFGIYGAKITSAIVPTWEEDNSPRSVRGCSLSHLYSVYNTNNPILVLEDDASPRMDIWDDVWNDILSSPTPDDCGILILGSETCENYIPSDDLFVKVLPPFFGTHAILYNTVLLKQRNFLLHAYQILASNKMGDSGDIHGIFYESVLIQALHQSGLSAYRPKKLPFTTIENISTRDGELLQPNSKSLDI